MNTSDFGNRTRTFFSELCKRHNITQTLDQQPSAMEYFQKISMKHLQIGPSTIRNCICAQTLLLAS